MNQPRCTAATKSGQQCAAFARVGSHLCAGHDPESVALRRRYSLPTLERKRAELATRIAALEARHAATDARINEIKSTLYPPRMTNAALHRDA